VLLSLLFLPGRKNLLAGQEYSVVSATLADSDGIVQVLELPNFPTKMPGGRRGLVAPQNTFLENVIRRSSQQRKLRKKKNPLKLKMCDLITYIWGQKGIRGEKINLGFGLHGINLVGHGKKVYFLLHAGRFSILER
jgi:hypothetical protein